MTSKPNYTFLGFDLSTQKLKAIIIGDGLEILYAAEVKFDTDLPEYRTIDGVNGGANKNEFSAQPVMWVKALDIVLDRLLMQGADFSTIRTISGSAQQHGSLFWSSRGIQRLQNLDSEKFLHLQIDDSAFVLAHTPIWMDCSTEKQCLEMEAAIGGRSNMIKITGSKCYPRFTGPQIRKIYQQRTRSYEDTQRISLVSSFLASIFLGKVAPIDYADASGMNLFDIKLKIWSQICLNACAPNLSDRLGKPVKTCSIIGSICNFFVDRYGFSPECLIGTFTGDNPSSLTGMLADRDFIVISLGTSDTLLMNLEEQPQIADGHVLCHPTEDNQFMGLLCFRNGSLVRENLKKTFANDKWSQFNELLESTPRGNCGNMAVHFHRREIIPNARGVLRWNRNQSVSSTQVHGGSKKFSAPQTEIRALIEGQMLHRRAVAIDMGFQFGKTTKIIATGGASVNKSILQVISDVFNSPVYIQKTSEAALLGAVYRAKYLYYLNSIDSQTDRESFFDYIFQVIPNHLELVCKPSADSDIIYTPMLHLYREMMSVLETKIHHYE